MRRIDKSQKSTAATTILNWRIGILETNSVTHAQPHIVLELGVRMFDTELVNILTVGGSDAHNKVSHTVPLVSAVNKAFRSWISGGVDHRTSGRGQKLRILFSS